MAFLGFGKKRSVPDELPDLISDEIEKEAVNEINSVLKDKGEQVIGDKEQEQEKVDEKKVEEVKEVPSYEEKRRENQVVNRLIKNVEETPDRPMPTSTSTPTDKSFFNELQNTLKEEDADIEMLKSLYEKKLKSSTVLDGMRDYWDKEKKTSDIELKSMEIKRDISDKISKLQSLEKSWQNVYFDLMEKEEAIKDSENELKDLLNELMKVSEDKKMAQVENSESEKEKEI